jgi:regulator of protease activity HflC (stomatin/prohibitin superfamily)
MLEIIGGMIVLTLMVLLSGIKVVREQDRVVVYRLGRAVDSRGPGLVFILPLIDRVQTVDTRLVTMPIPFIEEVTADDQIVKVSALCMYQIVDPMRAMTKVDDPTLATTEIIQTTLRNAIRQYHLRQLVLNRKPLVFTLKSALDRQTKEWGVRVKTIEIKEVKVPREIKRALLAATHNGAQDLKMVLKTDIDETDTITSYLLHRDKAPAQ